MRLYFELFRTVFCAPPMKHRMTYKACAALVLALCVTACGVTERIPKLDEIPLTHRIDIQQGNVITQEMLAQLRPGMDKKQVRFIMGTPMVQDTFHAERWDYLYTFKEGRSQPERRLITLYFDEDKLAHVAGDIVAAEGRIDINLRQDKIVEVPKAKERGLVNRVRSRLFSDDEEEIGEDEVDEALDEAEEETDSDLADSPGEETAEPPSLSDDEVAEESALSSEDIVSENEEAISEPEQTTEKKEEKGVFGRFLDRFGFGDKETKSGDEEDALIYRDPTEQESLNR